MQVALDGVGELGLRQASRLFGVSHSLLHYHLKRGTKPRRCAGCRVWNPSTDTELRLPDESSLPRAVLVRGLDGCEIEFESVSEFARHLELCQSTVSRGLRLAAALPEGWHCMGALAWVDDGHRRLYRRPKLGDAVAA